MGCMLIAKYSSQAHELMLLFLLGHLDKVLGSASTYATNAAASNPLWTRRARGKARRRTAALTHSAMGCTCAPRPGACEAGSGTTWPDSATTRNNSALAARSRQPTQVRTGPHTGKGSGQTTARTLSCRGSDSRTGHLGSRRKVTSKPVTFALNPGDLPRKASKSQVYL